MHILLSNDDGIFAEGINALYPVLLGFGQVSIVAPDRNCSATSQCLTTQVPLQARQVSPHSWAIPGTPADSVHLALTGLLEDRPTMVVSGANSGANMGDDVVYSGTVAAAIEGRHLGLPAIAVSLAGRERSCTHFETAAAITRSVVAQVIENPLPAGTILNVNVPDVPLAQVKGFKLTRLGKRQPPGPVVKETTPRGRVGYWIGPPGPPMDDSEGTDFYAVHHNYVSMTPLQIDMTQYGLFEQMDAWMEALDV